MKSFCYKMIIDNRISGNGMVLDFIDGALKNKMSVGKVDPSVQYVLILNSAR